MKAMKKLNKMVNRSFKHSLHPHRFLREKKQIEEVIYSFMKLELK